MARLTYEVVDGKASWDGRTLAEWVPDAVAEIVTGFSPIQILLFGSVARGEDSGDSDIDLLVIFEQIEGRSHDAAVAVLQSLAGIGAPVDVLVTDLRGIRERGELPGVLRVALREGEVVYERPA